MPNVSLGSYFPVEFGNLLTTNRVSKLVKNSFSFIFAVTIS